MTFEQAYVILGGVVAAVGGRAMARWGKRSYEEQREWPTQFFDLNFTARSLWLFGWLLAVGGIAAVVGGIIGALFWDQC